MTGKIKIVNGNVVREGEDIESGATTNHGENNVNNNNSQNVNNISMYHKGAIVFLVSVALFGMGVAFPVLMIFVLYNVYKSSSNNSSNASYTFSRFFNNNNNTTRRNNTRNGGSNIRTVSDLPKPPPSA
jgi:hypothetical protein